MNKQELIQKLQDIEWEDFEVKEAMREVPKSREKVREEIAEKVRRKFFKLLTPILLSRRMKAQLSQRTVDNVILKLKKAGFLKRVGPDKGGHWEISG